MPSSGKEDLPIYTDDTGSLSYFSAVLKIDESVLTNVVSFILLGIALVGLLLFLGVSCFKRKPAAEVKKSDGGEEEHATIAEIQQTHSHRGLEEHSCE